MGLGKTIQTISFLAHLFEHGLKGPFLIVCPLSTLANWVGEFERFTPDLPVLLYHGSVQDRTVMREQQLGLASANRKGKKVPAGGRSTKKELPIIVTTYELVINDRAHLSKIPVRAVWSSGHDQRELICSSSSNISSWTRVTV